MVDDFGIKYVGTDNLNHLINALQEKYKIKIDYDGTLYCGISLDWKYEDRYVDISVPGYVQKKLVEYNHPTTKKP